MECMATSDNVVRAGLTPKLRDVPTLISMLTYTWGPPTSQLMEAKPYHSAKSTTLYDPPIEEFSVLLVDIKETKTETLPAVDGPGILIITELQGKGKLSFGGDSIDLDREGQIFFVGAGTEIKLEGELIAYNAFVVAP
jgi:mannose-6-phosphate isomerase